MQKRYAIYAWVFFVFVLSELLSEALGVRFAAETLGTLYQYLDPAILRDDLLAGVYFLHAQPPLFNLGLGAVLKLFPDSYPAAFSLLFGAMALALLLGIARLMRALGASDLVIGFVCLVFALSPNFLVYRDWLFYTLPVALLLTGCALCLERGYYRLFAVLTAAVMLTRSVFHPAWLVVVAAVLLFFVSHTLRRRLVLAVFASLFVVNLWFLKNLLVFDSYAASTWLGMSLSKRWPLSQSEMATLKAEKVLPPYWHRRPFQEPSELEAFGFFQSEKDAELHPAVGAPYKSNGEPNFNHHDYIEISNAMVEGDGRLVLRYPGRYVQRVVTALLLFLQPGPNSVHFLVDYDFESVHRYRDAVTRYLFVGGGIERPIRMLDPPPNLMLLLFSALVYVGVRRIRNGEAGASVHAFMLVSVLWVTAVTCLVEIGENDRMRWEIEPFLAVWLALGLEGLRRRFTISSAAETA